MIIQYWYVSLRHVEYTRRAEFTRRVDGKSHQQAWRKFLHHYCRDLPVQPNRADYTIRKAHAVASQI